LSIYWESTVFGDLRTDGIHGRAGLGLSELSFTLVWSLHPTRTDVFTIFGTSIWISVQAEGESSPVLLGQAMPEAAWCDETRPFPQDGGRCMYRLMLPSPQLLALESYRQGRNLIFSLDIRGNSHCAQGVRRFNETLSLRVNLSDWTRVLREADAADVLLVGVHLPSADLDPKYRGAIDLVRKANHHLIHGDFTIAVAECRRALESLWKAANLTPRALKARQQSAGGAERQKLGKKDRELAYGEALKHLCHSAHHVGEDSIPDEFGRLDASLIVGSTAALISALVASPDLVEASTEPATLPPLPAPTGLPNPGNKKIEPPKNQRAEWLSKAIAQLQKAPANRPTTEEKLRKSLLTHFRSKLNETQCGELMADLKKRGVIKIEGKKVVYVLK
jgi:hypothetical protein